jgi:hypothetical protein
MRDTGYPSTAGLYARRTGACGEPVAALVPLFADWDRERRVAKVPVWAHRTVQFWRLFTKYCSMALPLYARREAGTDIVVCDPWAYSGAGAGGSSAAAGGSSAAAGGSSAAAGGSFTAAGAWALPLTQQHLLHNAAVVLKVAADAARAAGTTMIVGAVGSGGAGAGDECFFSQVFPWQYLPPAVEGFVQRTWLTADACCGDDAVGAVAVALNAHPLRHAHVYMLDVLVGRHSRSAASLSKPLWAQACVTSEVLKMGSRAAGTPWWPPPEAEADQDDDGSASGTASVGPAVVQFVQLAANLPDKVGKQASTLRHYLLLQYTVRTADRAVTHVHYADPFWTEDFATPVFWQRVRDEVGCRGLVMTDATVISNQHMLLHRQSQEAGATRNACGWLCLQGAARLLLGVVPDTVHWRRIRTGLLAAAAGMLHD